MSILGKYIENVEEQELSNNRGFTLPAVLREDRESMTMLQALGFSLVFYIAVIIVTLALWWVLKLLGIIVPLAQKPKPKLNDIEFVLVDKEDTPINKNTPYRADINSRAGGHHDPTQRVSMPSPAPSQPSKHQPAAAPAPAKQPAKPKQQTQPKQSPAPQKSASILDKITKPKPAAEAPAPKAKQPAKPNPPTARPSVKPPMTPKATQKPSSAFQVPVPSGGSKSGSYATGPVSGSGKAANGGSTGGKAGSNGSGKFSPAPSLAHSGKGSGSPGGKLGGGSGAGNPGPGNPNGRPGIDAIQEPDFGPYMKDLQRRIKSNWYPPKGNESKRVVLMFKIAKDGRLLSCNVSKSSGLQSADQAALDAVKASAPFKPLPAAYRQASVDIQFTFDYNVFGGTAKY